MIITIPANAVTNVSALLPTTPTDSNGVALKFANGEVSYYLNSGATPDFYGDAGWQRAKNNEIVRMAVGETVLWVFSTKEIDIDFEILNLVGGGGSVPAGAATEAKQDDQITKLEAITAAIQNKKQVGYARVEDANGDEFNQVSTIDASVSPPVMVVYYFDDAGVQQTPVAPINVINTDQVSSDMLSFKAIVATVNYAIGDTLTKRTILTNGAKTGSFWTNETTNLAISAPPSTDYEQGDDKVFVSEIGKIDDAAATSDTGNFSLIAFAKRTQERFTSLFGLFGTKSDTKETDPDATTSTVFGYLKGLLSAVQTKSIKTASKGTTEAGSPTSKNVSADVQAQHVVLAETAQISEVIPAAQSVYTTVWTGVNSGEFTLSPKITASFNFNFSGADTVKLQKKGFGADTNFYDFCFYSGLVWEQSSTVAARQTRLFSIDANSGVFRFVRTNSAVDITVVQ